MFPSSVCRPNEMSGRSTSVNCERHRKPSTPTRPTTIITTDEGLMMNALGIRSINALLATTEELADDSATLSSAEKSAKCDRYKTELCRTFEENGACRYGSKCQFAHGQAELRSVNRHPKYKTDLCRTFHSTGFCPYGSRCHFIHSLHETRIPSTQLLNSNIAAHLFAAETAYSTNRHWTEKTTAEKHSVDNLIHNLSLLMRSTESGVFTGPQVQFTSPCPSPTFDDQLTSSGARLHLGQFYMTSPATQATAASNFASPVRQAKSLFTPPDSPSSSLSSSSLSSQFSDCDNAEYMWSQSQQSIWPRLPSTSNRSLFPEDDVTSKYYLVAHNRSVFA